MQAAAHKRLFIGARSDAEDALNGECCASQERCGCDFGI
jgi:hypothetical protein